MVPVMLEEQRRTKTTEDESVAGGDSTNRCILQIFAHFEMENQHAELHLVGRPDGTAEERDTSHVDRVCMDRSIDFLRERMFKQTTSWERFMRTFEVCLWN